jgi:membrane fusion protein (multidrug efflux system)
LGAWIAWSASSRLSVYEVSEKARIEVDRAVNAIESPVAGRVFESRMVLGKEVVAGEVLLRLDSDTDQFALREEREKLAALDPELTALRAQEASVAQASQEEAHTAIAAADEVRARLREAQAPARYAEQELARLEVLHSEHLISKRDYEQGRAESQRTRAAADSLQLSLARMEQEQKTRVSDRSAALDQIRAQIARLEGQSRGSRAAVLRLTAVADRQLIRAPANGILGEVATLRPGSVVQAGQRIGVVVPSGRLMAVAQFAPSSALGRIRPSQSARLRLDGFPWAQYGTIDARVTRVANEIRDGSVRVELAVEAPANPAIRLEHGLPGSVEVAVERVAPLTLLLRAAGALQAGPLSTSLGGDH